MWAETVRGRGFRGFWLVCCACGSGESSAPLPSGRYHRAMDLRLATWSNAVTPPDKAATVVAERR